MMYQDRLDRAIAERPNFRRAFIDSDYSDFHQNLHATARFIATALLWVSGGDGSLALWLFKECPLAKRVDPVRAIRHAQREQDEAGRAT